MREKYDDYTPISEWDDGFEEGWDATLNDDWDGFWNPTPKEFVVGDSVTIPENFPYCYGAESNKTRSSFQNPDGTREVLLTHIGQHKPQVPAMNVVVLGTTNNTSLERCPKGIYLTIEDENEELMVVLVNDALLKANRKT